MQGDNIRVVILSDTHGLLPKEVLFACDGADHIIHAGDVGSESLLYELGTFAPVTSVLGNIDPTNLSPLREKLDLGGWRIFVQHIVWAGPGPSREVCSFLETEPADLVIFGHSHIPLCERIGNVVFLNPGSCGPKRFSLPKSFAEACLGGGGGRFRVFDLERRSQGMPLMDSTFELPS